MNKTLILKIRSNALSVAVLVLLCMPLPAHAEDHRHGAGAEEHDGHEHGSAEGHSDGAAGQEGSHEHGDGDDHAHGGEEGHHGHDEHGHGHEEAPAFGAKELAPFGVAIKTAGAGNVRVTLQLSGRLAPHEDRVAHVTPRYPGIVREVRKRLGDKVQPGEVVAVIESNQTLHVYEVKTLLEGTVVRRHANAGEFVDDKSELFELADYSVLFADFYAFPAQHGSIRTGQKLVISFPDREETAETTISFLAPATDAETQARLVRGILDNRSGRYQPGMFVTGEVVLEEVSVPLAVDASAVRMKGGQTIVFVEHDNNFEQRLVRIGRQDKSVVEILAGLAPGDRYASGNTFIVQAELEKGEAEHEH